MLAAAFRMVALAALLLMPFGMGIGAVRAQTPDAPAMNAHAGQGHCPDQNDSRNGKMPSIHCGGTCSALPVVAPPPEAIVASAAADPVAGEALPMPGLAPIPGTPPPKTA